MTEDGCRAGETMQGLRECRNGRVPSLQETREGGGKVSRVQETPKDG